MVSIYLDLARMMHDAGQISIGLRTIRCYQEMARLPVSKSGIGKKYQERADDKTHKYKLNYSSWNRTS